MMCALGRAGPWDQGPGLFLLTLPTRNALPAASLSYLSQASLVVSGKSCSLRQVFQSQARLVFSRKYDVRAGPGLVLDRALGPGPRPFFN